jgi:hypothetical protein
MNDGGQPFKRLYNPTVGKLGALGATEDTDPSKRKLDFKFDSNPEFIFRYEIHEQFSLFTALEMSIHNFLV